MAPAGSSIDGSSDPQEGTAIDNEREGTTIAHAHPQDLGSPPSISVTHPADDEEDDEDDTDSSDDGIVTMSLPSHLKQKNVGPMSHVGAGGGHGGGNSSDEDAESEEMRFGGEGLEGFVHSPRGEEEEGSESSDGDEGLAMGMGMKREEGHEEDLGGMRMS